MYNIVRITDNIKQINKCFEEIAEIGLTSDNSENIEKVYSSSLLIFNILNKMIDLAGEIITKREFGMPSSYQQYFSILSQKGIIKKELAKELEQLTKDRNIIAHNYEELTPSRVINMKKRIYYVRDFIEAIKKEVSKK